MKKFAYFIIIFIILAGGYYFYAQKNKQAIAPTVENGQEIVKETIPSTTPSPPPNLPPSSSTKVTADRQGRGTESSGTFSSGEEGAGMAPDVLVVQVNYDGSKFEPGSVDVKIGDIIIFKNNSAALMWPASAPHPSHTDYPEFDSKQGIDPGGKWQFKFQKAGSWKYHDHLNPSVGGVVNVSAR